MVEVQEIPVTKDIWEEMEKDLGPFTSLSLKIGEDNITLELHRNKDKYAYSIGVFINGVMKGAETPENCEKYWRKVQKHLYSPSKQAKIIKQFGKKDALKCFPNLDKKFTYFLPYFESFKQFKAKYKAHEIIWLKTVYYQSDSELSELAL